LLTVPTTECGPSILLFLALSVAVDKQLAVVVPIPMMVTEQEATGLNTL
jgi:hypothetical protein